MVKRATRIGSLRKGLRLKRLHPRANRADAASSVSIERTATGEFIINGKHQRELVNQFPQMKIRRIEVKPNRLSPETIAALVRDMKIG